AHVSLYQLPLVFVLLKNKSVSLAHLAASSSNAFLFFNLAFSAPPGLFLPSILPDAYRCGRAGPAVAYLRKLFGKDGLWTQPTLFMRGELPRMVQPMQRLWCQKVERCVAYFKRRWTNVTNVKKCNSRPAQKWSGPPGTLPILPITHPGPGPACACVSYVASMYSRVL